MKRGIIFLLLAGVMPLANAGVWDTSTPAGSEAKSLGDDRIREMKTAIQEALQEGGVFPGSDPSTTPRFYPSISTGTTALRPTGNNAPAKRLYLNISSGTLEMSQGSGSWNALDVVGSSSIVSSDLGVEVAGAGLDGGGGVPLRVNVDSTTFSIVNDTITIKSGGVSGTQIADGTITGSDVASTTFSITGPFRATLQPAFLVYLNSTQSNVTGEGTDFTIPYDTEEYDQTNNVSGSTFTAPMTGKYQFNVVTTYAIASVGDQCEMKLRTTSRNYTTEEHTNDGGGLPRSLAISVLASMSAGDTASVRLRCINGTKTDDIYGNGATSSGNGIATFFSGYLAN